MAKRMQHTRNIIELYSTASEMGKSDFIDIGTSKSSNNNNHEQTNKTKQLSNWDVCVVVGGWI